MSAVMQACVPNDGSGRDRLSPASPVVRLSDSDVSEMDVEEGGSSAVDFDKRGANTGGRSSRSAAGGGVPARSTSCSPTRVKQRMPRSKFTATERLEYKNLSSIEDRGQTDRFTAPH